MKSWNCVVGETLHRVDDSLEWVEITAGKATGCVGFIVKRFTTAHGIPALQLGYCRPLVAIDADGCELDISRYNPTHGTVHVREEWTKPATYCPV